VPTLPLSKSGRVCLMVYTKPRDSAVSPFEIEARIFDSSGSPHANPRVVLIGRSVPDADGLVKVLLELGPLDLPRGDYVFQVTFRDTSDRTIHSESASNFRVS